MYDYIIVGAGPAGLQMGYMMQTAGKNYVIIERNETPASFYKTMPRHRTLISINKRNNYFKEDEFNMRHDWNSLTTPDKDLRFTKYSKDLFPCADRITEYMEDFALKTKLNIVYNTKVTKISKSKEIFSVVTDKGETLKSKIVVMATGVISEYKPAHMKGLEHATTYATHSINPEDYSNKRVCIVGGGNSGFEVANHLAGEACFIHIFHGNKDLKMAWNTHYVGDVRAVNNTIIDMYFLKSLHGIIACDVTEIKLLPSGAKKVHVHELATHFPTPGWEEYDIEYDEVIVCVGWNYVDTTIFDKDICPKTIKNGRYPDLSTSWESSTPGLYYIGAAMAGKDRESASGFIHGFRYNTRTLYGMLEEKHFGKPLPSVSLPAKDLDGLTRKIIERVSTNDSIYQMNSFLVDVVAIKKNVIIYYPTLPKQYVLENWNSFGDELYIVYLNYGFDKFEVEPIKIVHSPDYTTPNCFGFLHPQLDYVKSGKYIDSCEITDSLGLRFDKAAFETFPQWSEETNLNYLSDFINRHQKWTNRTFDLTIDAGEEFIPLTEEELSRVP